MKTSKPRFALPICRSRRSVVRLFPLGCLGLLGLASQQLLATTNVNGTWLNTGTSANWTDAANWVGANVPGVAGSSSSNQNIATFDTAVGTVGTSVNPVLIDNASGLMVKSIVFDTASVGAFTIGTTGGNTLFISAGTITMNSAVTNSQTINSPLAIKGGSAGFSIVNNATSSSAKMIIGGTITAQNTGGGTNTVTLSGTNTGQNTVSGAMSNGLSTLAVIKDGTGTWSLTGTSSYTGSTQVNAGTLEIKSGASNLTQTMGVLNLKGADVTLKSNKSDTGTLSTTFTTLSARVAGNTGNIISTGGTNGTDNRIRLTQAAGFIDKGVYFNGADFAAMDAANTYVRALSYGVDANTVSANTITASNHVKLTSTPVSQAAISLRSLNLAGSGVNWTTTSGNLTVPGIIKSGGGSQSTISGGNLTTSSNAELVIRTDSTSDLLAISSNLTQGTGALTKSGAGKLTLSGTNTYTGQTFVNGGTLSIGANVNLGAEATGATLNLRGATLQATGTFGLFNGSAGTNNRAVVLTNAAGMDVTDGNTLTVAGVVSGAGSLTKTNSGTLTLSGANTYTGGTMIEQGKLALTQDFSMGSASVNAITISNAAGTVAGTDYAQLVFSGTTLTYGGSLTLNLTGTITSTKVYDLIDYVAGSGAGSFSSVSIAGTYVTALTQLDNVWTGSSGGVNFSFNTVSGDLTATLASIPEPSSFAVILGVAAMAGVLGNRRRSQRR